MFNRIATYLAVICFSLQAVVPAGFMPAGGSDGWFVKWCPEGMPTQVMETLFGPEHHHHHHHNHHHHNDQHHGDEEPTYQQCDLAGLALVDDSHDQVSLGTDLSPVDPELPVVATLYLFRPFAGYWSHAPPQTIEPKESALG